MDKKVKILLCGKNNVSIGILDLLNTSDVEVTCAYLESENKEMQPFQNFAAYALNNCKQVYALKTSTSQEFESLCKELAPDLIISSQFSVIINKATIDLFTDRIINIHFAPLPDYRGVSPITHAVLNNEKEFGVTMHLIDQGIDTGPIIDIAKFPITNLTNLDVYNLCTKHGIELVRKNISAIIGKYNNLKELSTPQTHENAKYYSKKHFSYANNIIDGDASSQQIVRFANALTFPPLSYPVILYNNNRLSVANPTIKEQQIDYEQRFGTVEIISDTISQIKSDEQFQSEAEGVYRLVHDRGGDLQNCDASFKNGNCYNTKCRILSRDLWVYFDILGEKHD